MFHPMVSQTMLNIGFSSIATALIQTADYLVFTAGDHLFFVGAVNAGKAAIFVKES